SEANAKSDAAMAISRAASVCASTTHSAPPAGADARTAMRLPSGDQRKVWSPERRNALFAKPSSSSPTKASSFFEDQANARTALATRRGAASRRATRSSPSPRRKLQAPRNASPDPYGDTLYAPSTLEP